MTPTRMQIERVWRVGRKVGRTIYAQLGAEPSDDDQLIGVMDTPELAEAVVRAHNAEQTAVHLTAYERRLLGWAISVAPWRFFNPGSATDSALVSAAAKLRGRSRPRSGRGEAEVHVRT